MQFYIIMLFEMTQKKVYLYLHIINSMPKKLFQDWQKIKSKLYLLCLYVEGMGTAGCGNNLHQNMRHPPQPADPGVRYEIQSNEKILYYCVTVFDFLLII